MKETRFNYNSVKCTLWVFALLFNFFTVHAQQHQAQSLPTGGTYKFTKFTGYYVSLPATYASDADKKFPLIISLHGVGELAGANATQLTDVVLKNGVPRVIKDGKFPASFTVKGKEYSYIVVTPQFKEWPSANDVYALLDYVKTAYRIDESRCYLTGLSMGGGVAWNTVSQVVDRAKGFAGAVIVCGAYYDASKTQLPVNLASINMPVWATHNEGDGTVTVNNSKNWVRDINAVVPAPNPLAKLTIFPVSGHDAWTKTSDPNFRDEETGLNMYEWFLQYYRKADGTLAFTEDETSTPPPTPPVSTNKRITVPVTDGRRMYYDNVMTALNVKPGDTLCIPAGDYDFIRFAKIAGTAEKPVIIKNCGGLVRLGVNSTTTIAAFILSDCKYFKIEGDGQPGLKYGFDINGTNKDGIKMYGMIFSAGSTDFDVHHAYVHDASMFVQAKTLQNCDHPEWLDGAFTMKNVKIHDLLCRRAAWEGFYIGNSHYLWDAGNCTGMKSHLVENLQVYNNDMADMGWDAIQIAMARNGENLVHNNVIHNYGLARNSAQGYGILCGGGSKLKIYNNNISKGYNSGIEIFGSGVSHVYNNVISDIVYEGINVADKLLFDPATAYIYNNTISNTGKNGIKIYADLTTVGHKLYNNIVIAEGTQWDVPQGGYYVKGTNQILFDFANNLNYKTLSGAGFLYPEGGNFRLKQGSPAINAGRSMSDLGLTKDLDGNTRPVDGAYDAGAFEYAGAANIAPVAVAGEDKILTPPIPSVVLDGSASLDADGTIASYSWTKVGGPAQGTISQATSAKATASGLVTGAYVFELKVTDNNGLTGTDRISVNVLAAANKVPVLSLGNSITVRLPSSSTTLSSSNSYDPDGVIVEYLWEKISGPSSGAIDLANSSVTAVSGLTEGVYVFQLTATDDAGGKVTGTVTVTVVGDGPVNKNPVANAGSDKTITLPVNEVELDGSASSDPDGSVETYAWRKVSGPAAEIENSDAVRISVTGLVEGVYEFELKVTDNQGATATDVVKVTVKSSNKTPVANAGADVTITLPDNTVTLNASASTDEDGTITAYAWRKVSGPAAVIVSAAAMKTNITGLVEGVYEFEVKVTDDKGATAVDVVKITVLPATNRLPVADAGKNITIVLPDNTANLDGSNSSDPDGNIVTYAWRKVSGPAGGNISDAAKAATTATGLQAGTYVFALTVTDDDGATASAQVQVVVQDVPNQLPVAAAGEDQTITLPTATVTLNGSASSDPDGQISAYLWQRISGPSNVTFSAADAAVNTASGLQEGVYVFQLTVTDNKQGTHSDRVTITVQPEPVQNRPPVAAIQGPAEIELPVDYLLADGSSSHGVDNDIVSYTWVQISGPATATIVNPAQKSTHIINITTPGEYVFELTVKDEAGLTSTARHTVTVLESANKEDSVRVYPVPATSFFYIDINFTVADTNLVLYLYSIQGKIVKELRLPQSGPLRQMVNIDGLPNGYYVVEVKGNKGYRWSEKIVKMEN